MFDLQTIPRKCESFCERQLGDETIFLSAAGDEVHTLDAVGTFIWQQLDGGTSLEAVLARLCAEYEVDPGRAESDLLAFIGELTAKKLLEA